MDPEQAKYHMKRCVDSGLWIADVSAEKDETEAGESEPTKVDDLDLD